MADAIALVIILIVLITHAYATFIAAPWTPIKKSDINRLIGLAEIKDSDIVYDLGAGDGRIVLEIAKQFPTTRVVGFEISITLFLVAVARLRLAGVRNARILFKNFYKQNLAEANVVTIFLMPFAMKKLERQFKSQLKPGTRILSYCFPLPESQGETDKPTKNDRAIYKYVVR
ncbi:MAG: hypothetical protein A3F24_00630 [Candidatus Colwellbacteria bacterium RIFCSPHIGHO2_12_FULL_44_17]|uniref:tRNA (guanine(46)-N(7))-methyltransferase n=1 Tax=Candidatus Colwellbacteria bacterium RIFCSPHIGHO2_12_FULL_44_17 TaxID=1797689 RepID=A0A1G1Z3V7_9BACT|nr:MAG: hypothetical protein A3F24_00630 [Candidatus Colwellbacteria bacterium RIFCSPHIGHO2_12_FULL_44_17]